MHRYPKSGARHDQARQMADKPRDFAQIHASVPAVARAAPISRQAAFNGSSA
jgi:hypothetical protein